MCPDCGGDGCLTCWRPVPLAALGAGQPWELWEEAAALTASSAFMGSTRAPKCRCLACARGRVAVFRTVQAAAAERVSVAGARRRREVLRARAEDLAERPSPPSPPRRTFVGEILRHAVPAPAAPAPTAAAAWAAREAAAADFRRKRAAQEERERAETERGLALAAQVEIARVAEEKRCQAYEARVRRDQELLARAVVNEELRIAGELPTWKVGARNKPGAVERLLIENFTEEGSAQAAADYYARERGWLCRPVLASYETPRARLFRTDHGSRECFDA